MGPEYYRDVKVPGGVAAKVEVNWIPADISAGKWKGQAAAAAPNHWAVLPAVLSEVLAHIPIARL